MASVIKSTLGTRSARPIAFNFEYVAQHANRYVDDVQAQASAMIGDATRQVETITQRAEERGRQAALTAVEQILDHKVSQQMETLRPALAKVISELADSRQAWLTHWERSAVQLAARIACRVIRRELKQEPQITVDLVREALQLTAGSTHVKISLAPADFNALGSQVQRVVQEISRVATGEVVADESVTPGGCRVETGQGLIDQQIESQLERIVAELTQ